MMQKVGKIYWEIQFIQRPLCHFWNQILAKSDQQLIHSAVSEEIQAMCKAIGKLLCAFISGSCNYRLI